MSETVIKVENLSKQYRLGLVGVTTISEDLKRYWAKFQGKEDPSLKIGHANTLNTKITTQNSKHKIPDYVWALKDINFEVKQGEVLGIIGKNGAGKSTLLKILSKVTAPSTGNIKIKGRIASLLEVGTGFHAELTGRENIFLNGAILGMTKAEIKSKLDEIIDFSGVESYIDTPVKRYSSGMYVRLAFAVAAHLEPEILILDEVLAVGDAEFQKKCLGKMGDVAKGGRTVLFVSHNLAAVENLCKQVILLENGNLVESDDSRIIIQKYLQKVQTIYNIPLESRFDRKGNGEIKLIDFYIKNKLGQKVNILKTGADYIFVFKYFSQKIDSKNKIDIGFGIHNLRDEAVTINYSSYSAKLFNIDKNEGEFSFKYDNFNIPSGRYKITANIFINGVLADWPNYGIANIQVVSGDFFGTGNKGYEGESFLLVNGNWS